MSRHIDQTLLATLLVDGLDAAPHQAIEQHLAACGDCRGRLEALRAADARLRATLPLQMSHLTPSPDAWARLQSTLAAPRRIDLRLAMAAALVLLAALLLAPSVQAGLRKMTDGWLRILVPGSGTTLTIDGFTAFTPLTPTSLPAGFDLTATGVHSSPQGDELQLTYSRGEEVFLLVERRNGQTGLSGTGRLVDLNGVQGRLQDPAETVDDAYRAAFKQGTIRLLTLTKDEVDIRLYSNLSPDDLLAFARSLRPAQR